MTDVRPVLIGMNNPISQLLEHALYPYPPGCTGWRLWDMLNDGVSGGVTKRQYLATFDRRNLVVGDWSLQQARAGARAMYASLQGREVLVLGNGPRDAFGLKPLLLHPQQVAGITWRQLPHPSGRNHWYNDRACRATASALLAELYNSTVTRELVQ